MSTFNCFYDLCVYIVAIFIYHACVITSLSYTTKLHKLVKIYLETSSDWRQYKFNSFTFWCFLNSSAGSCPYMPGCAYEHLDNLFSDQ